MKRFMALAFLLLTAVSFAQTTDKVILVSDVTSVDMLIAKAAGERTGIPVLVLTGGVLDDATRTELVTLNVKTVYLVGGPVVIKPEVETELQAKYTVVRLSGYERTGTAVAVARYFWAGGSDCVVLADDTKDSSADTNLQTDASEVAVNDECPFIPVPVGTLPADVLDVIRELNITNATFVGHAYSAEFRAKLVKLYRKEFLGTLDQIRDRVEGEISRNRTLKLIVIAAPNWKDVLGHSGHAGRHTIVRIASSTDAVPSLISLINERNITDVRILGNPTLADQIAGQLNASGINVTKISGDSAKVARDALNETMKKWEERKQEALRIETQMRSEIRSYLLERLTELENTLNGMEIELVNLNTTANPQKLAEIQAKIDAGQTQLNALKTYIENSNFDTAKVRIGKIMSEINALRWLHRSELRIEAAEEIEKEEGALENLSNVGLREIENRIATVKEKCASNTTEELVAKARTLQQDISAAMSSGDYPKAAMLSMELNSIVKQAKYLSDICEKTESLEDRFKDALEKRLGDLEEIRDRMESGRG